MPDTYQVIIHDVIMRRLYACHLQAPGEGHSATSCKQMGEGGQ